MINMHEVFIWTGLRYLQTRDICNDDIRRYMQDIWSSLSDGTRNCIIRDVEDMSKFSYASPDDAWNKWEFLIHLEILDDSVRFSTGVSLNEDFVLYAVKYAVGRMTYVVSWIVEELERIWHKLSQETKTSIFNYIKEAAERSETSLGMDCDKKQWMKVLSWET